MCFTGVIRAVLQFDAFSSASPIGFILQLRGSSSIGYTHRAHSVADLAFCRGAFAFLCLHCKRRRFALKSLLLGAENRSPEKEMRSDGLPMELPGRRLVICLRRASAVPRPILRGRLMELNWGVCRREPLMDDDAVCDTATATMSQRVLRTEFGVDSAPATMSQRMLSIEFGVGV